MDQEMTQKERPSIAGGRKISRLRPPQISALAKNKFGFLKETTVTEKAEFEQLEKPESCRSIPCKSEKDLWKEMVGEPVCVGGIKNGILRYFGPTKFADGLWCGVELNDPIGKNDGTIDGVSYFNCKKQHGIFAPLSKVQPITPSDSLFATKVSSSVQQHNETISLHKDAAQTMHKQSYAGISENKIRTNSLREPSKNLTFSAGFHNSTFSVGLRKPRDVRSFSVSDQHSVVGVKHDSTYNTNKNNLTIVTSKEPLEVNDNGPSHPNRNVDDCNMKRNDLCSGRNSNDCLAMNTTVNIEKSDLNTTFVLEDDLPEENEPVKSSDVLNTTFNLDSSVLNKNITQILPNKYTDQTNDFNTTFTFSELNTVGKVDKECFNESETGNCSQEKIRKLSIDDLFNSDDIDDDQQSLDLDESLGILTPNQMKDFTVSIDQQSVIMLDGSISRIPKISSCDNIDDIPEDEVRDTFSHLSNDSNFYTRVLTEDNLEHALNSPSFSQTQLTEGKTFVRLVHQFDNGDGQEFPLDCRQTSTPCASGKEICEAFSPIPFNNIMDLTTNIDKSAKKFNFFLENKHSENLEFPNSEACATIEHIADDIEKSRDESVNNCSHIEHEKIPDCSLLVNVSASSQDDSNNMHIKKAGEPFIKFENIMSNITHEEKKADECINLLKEIPKSSSNSFNNSYNVADTTKVISTDNASSDKQICFENECFEPDCLKTERPASTYTVGSTDTGYQEDGDFDVRSELSVATQSPCSELPAHSMYSSNRSMGIEDSERHPVVEIMSDSDFFTDSGGIGFTESEMETDGECKASNDFLQDSDKMCTVIEQSISENEDITSRVASEHTTPSEDQSVTSKFKEANETVILQSSTTLSSSTTESSKNPTINEDIPNKITIESKNDQTDKNSKVEKINSFIMADKEEKGNMSLLEKNIINNSGKRGLLNNKTVTKTQPEVPRNKRDNVLKSKILNDNVITEKRVRKNVVSKIKLMIESPPSNLPNKNDENNPKSSRLPKKSRWEDVTLKIAASMAEDKTKLKEKKEIKSRIDTNLVGTKPVPSRRGSRFDSTRNSFSVKNENTSGIDVPAAKNVRNISQRAKSQLPHHITDSEKTGNQVAPNTIKRNQLKPSKSVSSTLSNASYSSSTSKPSSGTPQNNAPQTTTGVKTNVSKQDMSSTQKTSLRFSKTQTSGRTTKRDENVETSEYKCDPDGIHQFRKQQRNRNGIPRLL